MPAEQQLVTTASILTFAGASAAVLVISTTLQRVMSKTWIGVPFITSLVVGTVVAVYSKTFDLHSPLDWLVAFVNCCLLFCAATGANEAAVGRQAGGFKMQSKPRGKWFESWLK